MVVPELCSERTDASLAFPRGVPVPRSYIMVVVPAKRAPSAEGTLIRGRVHMRARRDSVGINVSHGNRYEYWGRVRNGGQ
jgi:hypothetical protein